MLSNFQGKHNFNKLRRIQTSLVFYLDYGQLYLSPLQTLFIYNLMGTSLLLD